LELDSLDSWKSDVKEIQRAKPTHFLFLCVANSARSQIAEGLARSLAPKTIKISSAGSVPTTVNPLAVEALKEIGINISTQCSKDVKTIDPKGVDVVITLCQEEVCPVFLGSAKRFHWSMPDPASIIGNHDDKIMAFRKIRDELKRRFEPMFSEWSNI